MNDLSVVVQRIGGEILPDNDQYRNRFAIRSETSNRLYVIAQNKTTKTWSCSCPGWVLKKSGRDRTCKHLRVIMPVLVQANIGRF